MYEWDEAAREWAPKSVSGEAEKGKKLLSVVGSGGGADSDRRATSLDSSGSTNDALES